MTCAAATRCRGSTSSRAAVRRMSKRGSQKTTRACGPNRRAHSPRRMSSVVAMDRCDRRHRSAGVDLAPACPAVLAQGRARPDPCPRGGGRNEAIKQRLKDDPVRKTRAHPRLLQAARHYAGAQSAGAGVPAGDGGGAAGGAGTGGADHGAFLWIPNLAIAIRCSSCRSSSAC